MKKRRIEIEAELLPPAQRALGNETNRDTVSTAPQEGVHNRERRARLNQAALRRFAAAAHDLEITEVMGAAWR